MRNEERGLVTIKILLCAADVWESYDRDREPSLERAAYVARAIGQPPVASTRIASISSGTNSTAKKM